MSLAERVEVGVRDRDYNVYFYPLGQEGLVRYLEEKCRPLFGSDVYYDAEGTIFYRTWRDLPRKGFQPDKHVLVSRLPPRADISAPYTRYQDLKVMRIHQVKKDDGSVEAAIRSIDHTLEGERGKERDQAAAVKYRATELLDLFGGKSFTEISQDEFKTERDKTYALLARVGLDPEAVVNQLKQRMSKWLTKGSFGRDSTGRLNRLITTQALSAAHRRAIMRERGIGGPIVGKFVRMREALTFEREFCRTIFQDVADRLRPEAMPSHMLFMYPAKPPANEGVVRGMLHTMCFQLRLPHVKTYRTIGIQVEAILAEVEELLRQGKRAEIVQRGLFPQAYQLLVDELGKRQDIYP